MGRCGGAGGPVANSQGAPCRQAIIPTPWPGGCRTPGCHHLSAGALPTSCEEAPASQGPLCPGSCCFRAVGMGVARGKVHFSGLVGPRTPLSHGMDKLAALERSCVSSLVLAVLQGPSVAQKLQVRAQAAVHEGGALWPCSESQENRAQSLVRGDPAMRAPPQSGRAGSSSHYRGPGL